MLTGGYLCVVLTCKLSSDSSNPMKRTLSTLLRAFVALHTHSVAKVAQMERLLRSGQLPLRKVEEVTYVGRKLELLRARLDDGDISAVSACAIWSMSLRTGWVGGWVGWNMEFDNHMHRGQTACKELWKLRFYLCETRVCVGVICGCHIHPDVMQDIVQMRLWVSGKCESCWWCIRLDQYEHTSTTGASRARPASVWMGRVGGGRRSTCGAEQ